MRLVDADALSKETGKLWEQMPDGEELSKELMKAINHAPTVDAVPVKRAITVLMDLRDAFVAKQPRSEWYKDKTAQGVEKGIEMCIARIREMETE